MTQERVLAIANRGEIAVRIARTATQSGWRPVLLLGEPDRRSFAARTVGRVQPIASELDPQAVVAGAQLAGAEALHPGYGFLSERAELSTACADAGILFIGPSPETLRICGDKLGTRAAAERAGVPLLSASPALTTSDESHWREHAENVGYPLIVKVSGAGGGRGLRVARSEADLHRAVQSALNEAGASGAEATFYFERYLDGARHVEVQVAGDGTQAVALGDRDCSLQRRHQKVIEEAPAPGLPDRTRAQAHSSAVAIAREVGLKGVATVEFLLRNAGTLAFIEVNPRLQVEHTVTEEVTGLDLVAIQLQIATGGPLPEPVRSTGHAIQARLYAEDPFRDFLPSPGMIQVLDWPECDGLRIDAGYASSDQVPGNYDPLIAKLISHAPDRAAAIDILNDALTQMRIGGIATNRPWLLALLADERFQSNTHNLATAGDVTLELVPPIERDLRTLIGAGWRPYGPSTAWIDAGPFRIVSPATMVFHGVDEPWQASVSLDNSDPMPEGTVVGPHPEGYELSTPRGRWLVAPGPLPAQRAAGRTADGTVRSPMPGTIVTIHVEQDQRVQEGDVLAVMSAMKIEITLAAPFDGRVTGVHVAAGDLVGSREEIVTIVPEEKTDA